MAFLLGMLTYILEVTLFREVFSLMEGNELVIGFMFLTWFVFAGIGARMSLGSAKVRRWIDLWLVGIPYLLVIFLLLARLVSTKLALCWGAELGVTRSLGMVLGLLSFPAIVSGWGFSLFRRFYSSPEYVFSQESLGFGFFSLVFFFLLSSGIPVEVIGAVGFLAIPYVLRKRYGWFIALALVLPALVGLSVVSMRIHGPKGCAPGRLIFEKDSPYGRVAIWEREGQRSVFYNHRFISDFKNYGFSETVVHGAFLGLASLPSEVLVLGDMTRGLVREVLKYPVQSVWVYEKDPVLRVIEKLLYGQDPRVRWISWRDLKKKEKKFDVVISGFSTPSTLSDSFYLSREFFGISKRWLTKNGCIVVALLGAEDFVSDPLARFLAVVIKTVQDRFRYVQYVPGRVGLVVASDEHVYSVSEHAFRERYDRLQLNNRFFNPYNWGVMLSPLRLSLLSARVFHLLPEVTASSRDMPIVYDTFFLFRLYETDRWLYSFWPWVRKLFALFFVIWAFAWPALGRGVLRAPFRIMYSSFVHMALYLLLIFSYQLVWGSFYQDLTLFSGAYMVGLGLGAKKAGGFARYWDWLVLIGVAGLLLIFFPSNRWLVFSFVFLQSWIQGRFLSEQFSSSLPESVYLWDLVGAGLAAILMGPLALTSWGMIGTVLVVNFSIFWAWWCFRRCPL